ncbi:MAG: lasso peptide biosynthesis B2 protein [Pirellulaceae bacterium]|nr:lasso peptide biosynthesis B2 protein [Pirellulaceae bacterium]
MSRIKVTRLGLSDWTDLIRAQFALIRAQWLVWVMPTGKLVTPKGETDSAPPDAASDSYVRRLELSILRAVDYGIFRPKCLVQAVALRQLMQANNLKEAKVRVGVAQNNGNFTAHAWVEYRGAVLGDRDWHVRRFEELADLKVSL